MAIPKTVPNPELAKYLRKRRERLELTQEQIAQRLTEFGYPISANTISRWEVEGIVPTMKDPHYVAIISQAYEVTSRQLSSVFSQGGDSPHFGETPAGLDPELVALLQDANEEQMKIIIRVVRAIIGDE